MRTQGIPATRRDPLYLYLSKPNVAPSQNGSDEMARMQRSTGYICASEVLHRSFHQVVSECETVRYSANGQGVSSLQSPLSHDFTNLPSLTTPSQQPARLALPIVCTSVLISRCVSC